MKNIKDVIGYEIVWFCINHFDSFHCEMLT